MKKNWKKLAQNLLLILAGNTIYALAVAAFILPGGLITGGTTGLAITAEYYFQIPISVFVLLFNLVMFLLGAAVLGKAFALTTLLSTFYYPVILGVFQKIPALQHMTEDPMLATVFGGLMIGLAIGIVIRAGASTGGMDIPPLVLNKKLGLPVSVMLYGFDVTILLLQMTLSNKEQIIYGILLVLIYTMVLDKILLFGTAQTQVKIITRRHDAVCRAVISRLDRGCTLIHATTGYLQQEQPMVLAVVSNRELPQLNKLVQEIDPKAFMVVSKVNEVRGRGFSIQKLYRKSDGTPENSKDAPQN